MTRRLNPAVASRVDESRGDANSENCRRERQQPAGRAALQSAVLREKVRILYESPVVLLVSLTIAFLVAFSLRGFYPGWLGVAWAGLIVVISARLYDFWRYGRSPQPAEAAASRALRFTVGAVATGCLWGLIGSVLLLASDPALVADCPLHYTSPNAPKKRDVLGTAMLSMLAGHKRYAHIAASS